MSLPISKEGPNTPLEPSPSNLSTEKWGIHWIANYKPRIVDNAFAIASM